MSFHHSKSKLRELEKPPHLFLNNEHVADAVGGELSEFETELVAGGATGGKHCSF